MNIVHDGKVILQHLKMYISNTATNISLIFSLETGGFPDQIQFEITTALNFEFPVVLLQDTVLILTPLPTELIYTLILRKHWWSSDH